MKATAPHRQQPGKPISASLLQQLAQGAVRHISGSGVRASSHDGNLTLAADRQLRRVGARIMQVQSISDKYLTCQRMYQGVLVGPEVNVLKPWELIHNAGWYADATTITTVDAQTVTASDGVTTETWKVTPDYVAEVTRLLAYRLYTGYSDDASAAIDWIDLNVAGRAWAVVSS